MHLLTVARESLEELLFDFENFLRHRLLPQWAPDSEEARAVREVPKRFKTDPTDRIPSCPLCGKLMVLRTAKSGKNAGNSFWG